MSMQASSGSQSDPEETQRFEDWLRRSLYRFDCPDAHTLGEYALDLLEPDYRTSIAAHATGCDDCRAELAELRAYLAVPTPIAESFAEHARRVVATLFTPPADLAYSRLRGTATGYAQIFEVDNVTVSVGPGTGSGTIVGLVFIADVSPERLVGGEVRLV